MNINLEWFKMDGNNQKKMWNNRVTSLRGKSRKIEMIMR